MIRTAIQSGERLVFYSGGSMWPTFRPGDRFVLEECGAAELLPGEVVVFRSATRRPVGRAVFAPGVQSTTPRRALRGFSFSGGGWTGGSGRLIAHRVLRVARRDGRAWVLTQGDSSPLPDPAWPGDRLVGRVVEVSPAKGRPAFRKLAPAPFLGWRLRHRVSVRRIVRGLWRRAGAVRRLLARAAPGRLTGALRRRARGR